MARCGSRGKQELSRGQGLAHRPEALPREQKAAPCLPLIGNSLPWKLEEASRTICLRDSWGHEARITPFSFLERSCLFQHCWSLPCYPESHSLPCPWMMVPLALCPWAALHSTLHHTTAVPSPDPGPSLPGEVVRQGDTISGVTEERNGFGARPRDNDRSPL